MVISPALDCKSSRPGIQILGVSLSSIPVTTFCMSSLTRSDALIGCRSSILALQIDRFGEDVGIDVRPKGSSC